MSEGEFKLWSSSLGPVLFSTVTISAPVLIELQYLFVP
jgi:hypothetical protein